MKHLIISNVEKLNYQFTEAGAEWMITEGKWMDKLEVIKSLPKLKVLIIV